MASLGTNLSFFFFLVLLFSPQIQAREGKFFSLFSHFRTKQPHFVLKNTKTPAPAPAPAPALAPVLPVPAPTTTIASAPAFAPEYSIVAPGPAPEAFFLDRGDGYGLYGTPADPNEYSPAKETPTYTNFENELLNEDLNGESYKTGYPKLPPPRKSNYNNEILYRNQYNREEYRSNYNGNEYKYNNPLNNYYDGKREGMSDTRFVENGKYYDDVKNENENEYSTGYFEKNKYPNEYNTMEEYEKEQQGQGYIP